MLLNNAGASFSEYQASADGYEMTFALNHMSYYLLSHLLLDMLKATAGQQGEARIVGRTPQKGAETAVYLATAPEVAGISGKYWADKTQRVSSELSHDREAQQRIWDFSAEISGVG